MISEKQKENLEKLKKLIHWINDLDSCLYEVQAQYVVASSIFNYIETLGMFLKGYNTKSRERFESFFSYLGPGYEYLIKNNKNLDCDVYNELRCGLTHELIPKKRKFIFIHAGIDKDWWKKDTKKKLIKKEQEIGLFPSGVMIDESKTIWLIHVPKLMYDFQLAEDKLIKEIESGKKELIKNFDEVANKINLKNFSHDN